MKRGKVALDRTYQAVRDVPCSVDRGGGVEQKRSKRRKGEEFRVDGSAKRGERRANERFATQVKEVKEVKEGKQQKATEETYLYQVNPRRPHQS